MNHEIVPFMVPLSEIRKRANVTRMTVYRWLKKKGVRTESKGVLMSELKTRWPGMYLSIVQATAGAFDLPPCPGCGGPTRCRCLVCEIDVL